MPTENRRVAAYLPKAIDQRLESFKAERGLKGDSQALIAILEEFFGVSQEVVHSGSSRFDSEVFRSDLLSELKGELLSLKSELRSELLSELKGELLKSGVDQPKQLSLTPNQDVDREDREALDESELPSGSISDLPEQSRDSEVGKESGLPIEPNGKPLDGSVTWSGVELSRRLIKVGPPDLSARKDLPANQFAEWTQKKDPNGIAWKRIGKGKYVPIVDSDSEF